MSENSFMVSYITTLPKEGNAPRVTISGSEPHRYHVSFYQCNGGGGLISSGFCNTNQTIIGKVKQWYTEWLIVIKDENGKLVFQDIFKPADKVIFIKMDAYALGDSIAWIPYVDKFRKWNRCTVICSTFHNHLFIEAYPDILFVKPDTVINNVYAQYYIGATNDDNPYYSPIKVNKHPLQDVASSILGLKRIEIRPDLSGKYKHTKSRFDGKYVTLSEFGSTEAKQWKVEGGWQGVVNYLNDKGYKVLVISKEKTNLINVIDLTGDISLDERAIDILHADFHLGVSSGLSWLAWALGKHTVMISDVTPSWHEFKSDITRINANNLTEVNYLSDTQSSLENVLINIGDLTL